MALAALADIRDDELLLPFASDGRDNTDHCGRDRRCGDARARTRTKSVSRRISRRAIAPTISSPQPVMRF